MRIILSLVAGMVLAFVLLTAVEVLSAAVYPLPEGFGHTQEEMCRYIESYPQWVLAVAVLMWGGIAFVSVWLTGKLGNRVSVAIIGTLLLAACVGNCAMLPYPTWFKLIMPVVALSAIVVAARPTFRRQLANNGGNENKG